MRTIFFPLAFLISGVSLRAQDSSPKSETIAVLPPMVISGSFELQRRPSITELMIKDVERQFDQKQKAAEEAARTQFWRARFWDYVPLLTPTDDQQFFNPSYLTLANQHSLRDLELSEKHSLIDLPAGQ